MAFQKGEGGRRFGAKNKDMGPVHDSFIQLGGPKSEEYAKQLHNIRGAAPPGRARAAEGAGDYRDVRVGQAEGEVRVDGRRRRAGQSGPRIPFVMKRLHGAHQVSPD
jgi:hypothetical protein